jgi:hypothetical protein
MPPHPRRENPLGPYQPLHETQKQMYEVLRPLLLLLLLPMMRRSRIMPAYFLNVRRRVEASYEPATVRLGGGQLHAADGM